MSEALNGGIHILLVEDNPGDVDLAREALGQFKTPHTLRVASDGAQALEFLFEPEGSAPVPDLILLDFNLPKTDGRELLAIIKNDERLGHIPVIVLTSSNAERDMQQAYRLHANCFLTKPTDIGLLFAMFELIERFWLQLVKLPSRPGPRDARNLARPAPPATGSPGS
jgi:two-component system, chemotaxis family, response regulator Rcp1